jgi:hypothetical protein
MSARRMARLLWHLLAFVVLGVSGAYLLIYLYRWEWNRALVSGLFFIAAEVLLVGSTILERLRRIEQRSDERSDDRSGLPTSTVVRGAADEEGGPFPWLEESHGVGVFVPVLVGLGVVLSALAYLVERLAASTAPAIRDEGVSRRMASLDPMSTRFLPPPAAPGLPPDRAWDLSGHGPHLVRVGSAASGIIVLLVSALVVTAIVNVLADVATNRPDPELVGRVSVVDMEISQKIEGARSADTVAEAFWISCRGTLPDQVTARSIELVAAGRVRIVLDPAIGRNSRRRFVGCLEDLNLDQVLADVEGVWNVPA